MTKTPTCASGAQLPAAPVQRVLPSPRAGVLTSMDTRLMGMVVVALGGGRRRATDPVDPRVGLTRVLPVGSKVRAGDPLLRVHAANAATFFNIHGAMVYVDDAGNTTGYEDVFTKIAMCRQHYEAVGLGGGYVDQFVR